MNKDFLFTSESVTSGHPDKIADQISDAILDEVLKQDTEGRVACETMVCGNKVILAGEITTTASVNYEAVVRSIIKEIGFDNPVLGFDYNSCEILNFIRTQSSDISHIVNTGGANDQGIMFGYACDETPELMPLAISLSHKLAQRLVSARKNNIIKGLRPDGKVQVTVLYKKGKPYKIENVLISTQHNPEVSLNILKKELRQAVIKPVCFDNKYSITSKEILINPTGKFVIGGPVDDCGMTGRKIIVDTYGGYSRHGGGAFSGKDPSKLDRSAAYMARYMAKNVVASGIATKCEIQLSYAIGVFEPISIMVDSFGTGDVLDESIVKGLKKLFSCTPKNIIETLNLKNITYKESSVFGHFGRKEFPWEATDFATDLIKVI